ncbi:MAG: acyl-CoA thioesterase II [Pseudomonadota bacterium]
MSDLVRLLENLRVERLDKYLFAGKSPASPRRVFGGQVLAQALNAAIRTVDEADRQAHSMHAYFLRPGDPQKQIIYEVDPIRDGRSFTTRRVVAKQEGRAIFNTSISFHVSEPGFSHQFDAPEAPDPESLESDKDFWARMAKAYPDRFEPLNSWAIDRRHVYRRDPIDPGSDLREPRHQVWMRALGELENDPILHQTLLAYMSDMTLLGVSLNPHSITTRSDELMFASLDHALWFHQPFAADRWLLYDQDSPLALSARGFMRGSFYSDDGKLVASVAQEALVRPL